MLEDNQFYLGFNSTLVQLKVWLPLKIVLLIISFNSTLVQLKEETGENRSEESKFQFYLSSIKSDQ